MEIESKIAGKTEKIQLNESMSIKNLTVDELYALIRVSVKMELLNILDVATIKPKIRKEKTGSEI